MRNTFLQENTARYGRVRAPAGNEATGSTVPSPIGGWDAISPISNMPAQNAVELINWFPQPGYVELRKGFVNWCDTGTGTVVETVMEYQSQISADDGLLAASGGTVFDVTGSTPTTITTGFLNDRWQYTNFTTSGGSFLWMCNGEDVPQYWDGSALAATVITVVTPEDIVYVCPYRSRLWMVIKDSNIAAYLDVDSIQGAATEFPLETYFVNGGSLLAIGTWSTDTNLGPNEFIAFVSTFGDIAVFQIEDPDDPTKIFYRGTATVGSPIGRRCLCKIGSDLAIVTINGVLPVSQVLSYDRSALLGKSFTKNINQAMTLAAQNYKDNFGWQLISYPRSTMAILNVPTAEGSTQQQYVMNTITGSWAQFVGQNGNCWAIFGDRAYFGGNDGIVRLADESGGDEDQEFNAGMRCAFNYYGVRGREKRWTTIRPSVTIDTTFPVLPEIGLNVDFQTDAVLYPITFNSDAVVALWGSAIWGPDPDAGVWPGEHTDSNWAGIEGIGYCASIRMTVDIPWSEDVRAARALKINSFDMTLDVSSGFI